MKTSRDPLGPIGFVVGALFGLLVLPLVILLPLTPFVDGMSAFGIGDKYVCLEDESLPTFGGVQERAPEWLARGVEPVEGVTRLCRVNAPLSQQLLGAGSGTASYLFVVGFVFMLWRLTRRARARLFAPGVSRTVTQLGVYLLAGSLVAAAIGALCTWLLQRQFLTDPEMRQWLVTFFDWPWASLIAGLCTLSVGRVLTHAVRMQREVDTLV